MKRCPQCNRVETDDTMAFCRADGTVLVNDSSPPASKAATAGTSAPSEIETSLLPHKTDVAINRSTTPTPVLPGPSTPSETRKLSKPQQRRVFSAIVLAGLVIAVAVGGYFYFLRGRTEAIDSIAVILATPRF